MSDSGAQIEQATKRFLSRKVTRRQFGKEAAAVGAASLLPKLDSPLVSQARSMSQATEAGSAQLTEEEQMKREIEQKYGIVLSVMPSGTEFPSDPMFTGKWEQRYFPYLDTVLSELPPHFYAPDDQGRITNIRLRGGTSSCCEVTDKERILNVRYRVFDNLSYAGQDLSHELTHLAGMDPIFISQGDETVQITPSDALKDILGDPFPVAQPILQAQLSSKLAEVRSRGNMHTEEGFLSSFNHALANDAEFIAVAGQEYFVKGKENFYKLYGLLFSDEQVDKIYNFTKAIYGGKEYDRPLNQRHPEIT